VRKLGKFVVAIKEEVGKPTNLLHELVKNAEEFFKKQELRTIEQDKFWSREKNKSTF